MQGGHTSEIQKWFYFVKAIKDGLKKSELLSSKNSSHFFPSKFNKRQANTYFLNQTNYHWGRNLKAYELNKTFIWQT